MQEDGFLIERRAGVAIVTMNRPEKLNALTIDHLVAIGRICRGLGADPEVRCVVVTGAGRAFSAGADLSGGGSAPTEGSPPPPTRVLGTELDFITPFIELGKPTIAAVNGISVGASLGIALACDIRLCSESGTFWANFGQLGLAASDGVGYLLPRLVGLSKAFEILYTSEKIDAQKALQLGLVSQIYPDAMLMAEALALAERIASAPPVATQMTRAAVLNSFYGDLRDGLVQQELAHISTMAYGAHDVAEAIAAWREKRSPVFSGVVPGNVKPKP